MRIDHLGVSCEYIDEVRGEKFPVLKLIFSEGKFYEVEFEMPNGSIHYVKDYMIDKKHYVRFNNTSGKQ